MGSIINSSGSIGSGYPSSTGRLKQVRGKGKPKKVALLGDSTIDNGYWVEERKDYTEKTHTVMHQTAVALAHTASGPYDIGNFAVDGATTEDIGSYCSLSKVVLDEDHQGSVVHQLNSVAMWEPDVAVLSVGGIIIGKH